MKKLRLVALVGLFAFGMSACTDTAMEEFESEIELQQSTDDEEGEPSKPSTGG